MLINNNMEDKNNTTPKAKDIASDFNTMISYSGKIGGEMVRRMIQQEEFNLMNEYNKKQ